MLPAQADGRDFFSSPPQSALGHSLIRLGHQSLWACGAQNRDCRSGFHERASAHHGLHPVRRIKFVCFISHHAKQNAVSACSTGDQTRLGIHSERAYRPGSTPGSRRWLKNPYHHFIPESRSDRFPLLHSSKAWTHRFRKRSPRPGADPFATSVKGSLPPRNFRFRSARV